MISQSKSDKEFQKLVLKLFTQYRENLVLIVNDQSNDHLDIEIRIPELGKLGFRAIVNSHQEQVSEEDPDPRQFGDTAAVTAAAMRDWYPGKRINYTRHSRNFMLQAWNLPSSKMNDYSASYLYDPTSQNYDWSGCYEIEKVYQLLTDLIRIQARKRAEDQEQGYADDLRQAFKGLFK